MYRFFYSFCHCIFKCEASETAELTNLHPAGSVLHKGLVHMFLRRWHGAGSSLALRWDQSRGKLQNQLIEEDIIRASITCDNTSNWCDDAAAPKGSLLGSSTADMLMYSEEIER